MKHNVNEAQCQDRGWWISICQDYRFRAVKIFGERFELLTLSQWHLHFSLALYGSPTLWGLSFVSPGRFQCFLGNKITTKDRCQPGVLPGAQLQLPSPRTLPQWALWHRMPIFKSHCQGPLRSILSPPQHFLTYYSKKMNSLEGCKDVLVQSIYYECFIVIPQDLFNILLDSPFGFLIDYKAN